MTDAHSPASPPRYAATTRFLHWVVALMVIATMPIGTVMLQEGLARPTQDLLFILHKNGGVIILLLVVLRLLWRALRPAPPMPATVPGIQQRLAHAAHAALYGMLLFMAITGYVRVVAGGFPLEMADALGIPPLVPRSDELARAAQTGHHYGRYLLVTLILAHVAAALYHGILRRDGVFSRIWPPAGR